MDHTIDEHGALNYTIIEEAILDTNDIVGVPEGVVYEEWDGSELPEHYQHLQVVEHHVPPGYDFVVDGEDEEMYEEVLPDEPQQYQFEPSTSHGHVEHISNVIDSVASEEFHDVHIFPEFGQPGTKRQATIVECEVCGVVLKHPSKIQAHLRTHTGEKPFQCAWCGMRFTQRTPWRNHEKRHLGDIPFQCSCGKRFPSNSLRNAHELRHIGAKRKGPPRPHLKPPKRVISMDEQSGRFEEERTAIIEYQPPIGHIEQPLSAAAAKRIDDIIEAVASGGQVQPKKKTKRRAPIVAQCQYCGLLLKHPSKIQAHMRTHTGEKPFECQDCGQRFSQPHPLLLHVRRKHTGEKPYACTWECGMTFVSLALRNEHEKIVHAGIKRYGCTATGCKRMFSRRRYLMMHRARDHPHLYAPAVENELDAEVLAGIPSTVLLGQKQPQILDVGDDLEVYEEVCVDDSATETLIYEGEFVEEEDGDMGQGSEQLTLEHRQISIDEAQMQMEDDSNEGPIDLKPDMSDLPILKAEVTEEDNGDELECGDVEQEGQGLEEGGEGGSGCNEEPAQFPEERYQDEEPREEDLFDTESQVQDNRVKTEFVPEEEQAVRPVQQCPVRRKMPSILRISRQSS